MSPPSPAKPSATDSTAPATASPTAPGRRRDDVTDSGFRVGGWVPRSAGEICTLVAFVVAKRTSVQISLPGRHEPPTDQHTPVSATTEAPGRGAREERGPGGVLDERSGGAAQRQDRGRWPRCPRGAGPRR